MENENNFSSQDVNGRRKLIAGIGMLSLLAPLVAAAKAPISVIKTESETKGIINKIKMLTKDGKLVEVDERFVTANKQKASSDDIKNWVHK